MGVNLRRRHVGMTKQPLGRPDVSARPHDVGSKSMAQSVRREFRFDFRLLQPFRQLQLDAPRGDSFPESVHEQGFAVLDL